VLVYPSGILMFQFNCGMNIKFGGVLTFTARC